jgi:hypothetical protein
MGSAFPKRVQQYYIVHETISALLGRDSTADGRGQIKRRIQAQHPELEMGPALLKAAIRQALKDTEFVVGGQARRVR